MKVGSAEWHRYRVALFLAEPFRVAIKWLRVYNDDGWGEHGYEWTTRRTIADRLITFLEPLRTLPFIWIARNATEDDWSIIEATKATICLLLHLSPRYDKNEHYDSCEVAWFGVSHTFRRPGDGGARRWASIRVGEPGRWFAYIEEDSCELEW